MTLYEITKEMKNLEEIYLSCIDEETGELKDGETLEELNLMVQAQIKEKGLDLIKFFVINDNYIQNFENEIKRLTSLKKKIEKKKEDFKKYVVFNMEKMGINKIETELGSLSIRKSKSVDVYDEMLIDKKFISEEIKYKISKTDIKKAIENGEEVQGARIVINSNLNLK